MSESELERVAGMCLPDAYTALAPFCDPTKCARCHLAYVREHLSEIHAYAGVGHVLEAAKGAGIRIGAATSHGEIAEGCLVSERLYSLLDCLVTQEEVSHPKPHPESLLLALRLLGPTSDTRSRSVLFVGDTPVDVQAARSAGIPVVGVTYGACDRRTVLAADPDCLIERFDEMLRFVGAPIREGAPAL